MCCPARPELSQNQPHTGVHRLDNFHSIRSEIPSCPRIAPCCRIGTMWSWLLGPSISCSRSAPTLCRRSWNHLHPTFEKPESTPNCVAPSWSCKRSRKELLRYREQGPNRPTIKPISYARFHLPCCLMTAERGTGPQRWYPPPQSPGSPAPLIFTCSRGNP